MKRTHPFCTLNLSDPGHAEVPDCASRERLSLAFARLQTIQDMRAQRQDPRFGRSVEDKIVWRELLDLELQEADEQIERIAEASTSGE
ncbi:MAG TPA: hypothetical protein VGN17_08220 [Bryobacteraceae bacterium]